MSHVNPAAPRDRAAVLRGGEGEIRTPETLLGLTRFRVVRLRPLGHLSIQKNEGAQTIADHALYFKLPL